MYYDLNLRPASLSQLCYVVTAIHWNATSTKPLFSGLSCRHTADGLLPALASTSRLLLERITSPVHGWLLNMSWMQQLLRHTRASLPNCCIVLCNASGMFEHNATKENESIDIALGLNLWYQTHYVGAYHTFHWHTRSLTQASQAATS